MKYIPWILRVVIYPDRELDLLDHEGNPDHAKIMGYYAFTVFIALVLFNRLPSLGWGILLCSVVFGWIGMRTFLNSRIARIDIQETYERNEGNPGDKPE